MADTHLRTALRRDLRWQCRGWLRGSVRQGGGEDLRGGDGDGAGQRVVRVRRAVRLRERVESGGQQQRGGRVAIWSRVDFSTCWRGIGGQRRGGQSHRYGCTERLRCHSRRPDLNRHIRL